MNKVLQLTSTKAFTTTKENDEFYIEGYATTPTLDRDQEIIPINAVKTENFLKNPILMFNHDRSEPIGKVIAIEATNLGWKIKAFISETATKIKTLIEEGILKAFSIGFKVNDYEINNQGVLVYKDIDLFEVSVVAIPANPDAVFEAVKSFNNKLEESSMNIEELKKEKEALEKILKEKEAAEKAAAEKAAAEKEAAEKAAMLDTIKTLKDTISTISTELDEVKKSKTPIQMVDVKEKTVDEFIEKFADAVFEKQLFNLPLHETKSFKGLPERVKAVNMDAAFLTKVNNKILEDIKENAPLFKLFAKAGSDAKTDVYPFEGTVTSYWGSLTKSTYSLESKISFDYKKILAGVEYSYDYEGEAVISWLPKLRADIVAAIGDGIDNAIINSTAVSGWANAFRGLISYAVGGSFEHTMTGADNTLTAMALAKTRGVMGKYGVNPKKVAYIVNSLKYLQLIQDSNFMTVDKYGNNATILTGELGKAYGSPVFVNDYFPGVDTASATAYSALAFRTDMFGAKAKPVLVEIDKNIETQNKVIVASMNVSFIPLLPLTAGELTAPIAALCVNGA